MYLGRRSQGVSSRIIWTAEIAFDLDQEGLSRYLGDCEWFATFNAFSKWARSWESGEV